MMSNVLDQILDHKRIEVERQKAKVPLAALLTESDQAPPPRPFAPMLRHADRMGLITEIKKQSPSKGLLAFDFDPLHLAQTHQENGADAISILTDMRFFGGSLQHLKAVRSAQLAAEQRGEYVAPLLRKDFLIDPYQVVEARAYGADAILVIVRAVEPPLVRTLIEAARDAGLEALVEVRDEAELAVAMEAGAQFVGINNRDLGTFDVDVSTTERLLGVLPSAGRPIMVSLSGFA